MLYQIINIFVDKILDIINIFVYNTLINDQLTAVMKYHDLIKLLHKQGATFKEGTKHTKAYLNGKQTTIPRHKEVNEITAKNIIKQLQASSEQ